MTAADRELHELRRELLLARAAAERAQLAYQIDRVTGRTAGGRSVAAVALRAVFGLRRAGPLGVVLTALQIARRQPWLVSAVVASVVRLSRGRLLRWLVLTGALAGAMWWLRRRARNETDRTDAPTVADAEAFGDME